MDYFFIDSWDLSTREAEQGGYSQAVRRGKWELERLPLCPRCGCEVWPRTIRYPFEIEFTGSLVGDITFGFATTLVVSDRFRQEWLKSQLTGLVFSEGLISITCRRKAVFATPSRIFYAAYPEPTFARISQEAMAVYSELPECPFCSVGVVDCVKSLLLDFREPPTDFFLPSALPSWFVVSERVKVLVDTIVLENIRFFEGFAQQERQLIRYGYWEPGINGRLSRIETRTFF